MFFDYANMIFKAAATWWPKTWLSYNISSDEVKRSDWSNLHPSRKLHSVLDLGRFSMIVVDRGSGCKIRENHRALEMIVHDLVNHAKILLRSWQSIKNVPIIVFIG